MVHHSHEVAPRYQEIYSSWRDIKKNAYLAPNDLRKSLNNYSDARQKFRMAKMNRAIPREGLTEAKAVFDQTIEELKPKIKDRCDELSRQLEEYETKLDSPTRSYISPDILSAS